AGHTRKRSSELSETVVGGLDEKRVVSESDDDVELLTDDDSEKENAVISDDQQQPVCASFDATAKRNTRLSDTTHSKGVQFVTPRRTRAAIESSSEDDEESNQGRDESGAQGGGWDADDSPEETPPVTIEESDDNGPEEPTTVTIEESDDDEVVAVSQEFVYEIEQSPDAVDREKHAKKTQSLPASGRPKRPESSSPEVLEVIPGNPSATKDNEVQIIRSKPVARPKLSAKARADLEVQLANAR
ncbi:hypothetical protein AAVH_38334, partial [Aphelenchoides avenae]